MTSTLDSIREALQVALLPKLTAIEKDLAALRAEVNQQNQELRAELKQTNQELRAELIESAHELRSELTQSNQELRAEIKQSNLELRADMDKKFALLVSEIQKLGLRLEFNATTAKAETETYVHRTITPLAERVAVLEMSLRDLKEKFEKAS